MRAGAPPARRPGRPITSAGLATLTVDDFASALREAKPTAERLAVVRPYGSIRLGLTVAQLGRHVEPDAADPVIRGNGMNGNLAQELARHLGFEKTEKRQYFVNVICDSSTALSPFGHQTFWPTPALQDALDRDRSGWGDVRRTGSGPAQPEITEPTEPGRRLEDRLARDGQPQFRRALLILYYEGCAVTRVRAPAALEACHIERYAATADDDPRNGLVLRRDLHRLFDLGLVLFESHVEAEGRVHPVRVHPSIEDEEYRLLDLADLWVPERSPPDPARLATHAAEARKRARWPKS